VLGATIPVAASSYAVFLILRRKLNSIYFSFSTTYQPFPVLVFVIYFLPTAAYHGDGAARHELQA
jgi:hypothetical protein